MCENFCLAVFHVYCLKRCDWHFKESNVVFTTVEHSDVIRMDVSVEQILQF